MKLNKPILSDDYRHSASRGVDYIENPSLWLMRNYFGVESKQNYSMAMGTVAEYAAYLGLKDTLEEEAVTNLAETQFKTMCEDLLKEDQGVIPKQLDKVGRIANNFIRFDVMQHLDAGQRATKVNSDKDVNGRTVAHFFRRIIRCFKKITHQFRARTASITLVTPIDGRAPLLQGERISIAHD